MRKLSYANAINEAMFVAMQKSKNVITFVTRKSVITFVTHIGRS